MPYRFTRIASVALALCCTTTLVDARINIRGKLPRPTCTKTICGATVQVGNLVFTDGDNYVATMMNNFTLNLFQSSTPPGPTNWLVGFDQYNKTEDYPAGLENIYIRFVDKYGNYLPETANFLIDRSACRSLGHKSASGTFSEDLFKRGARYFEITQQTLSATLGGC